MSTAKITMDALSPGDTASVEYIENSPLSCRLTALGLTPGTEVHCLFRAPLGDPAAFSVRGAVIALRREDSRYVHTLRSSP